MMYAPWSPEQIKTLEAWQRNKDLHPYTCGNGLHSITQVLIPTVDGWVCPSCDYTQNWAHPV